MPQVHNQWFTYLWAINESEFVQQLVARNVAQVFRGHCAKLSKRRSSPASRDRDVLDLI
jgi:hypothetical protein